jgi:hypothetical protein
MRCLPRRPESGARFHNGFGPASAKVPVFTKALWPQCARSVEGPCTPPWTSARPSLSPVAGSGRALPRHSRYTAYGCSLPGLTGFTAPGRAGPDHPHCLPGAARSLRSRRRVISPAYRGFPVQGTPSPPPSTASRRRRDLNPWTSCEVTRSPGVPVSPLPHVSAAESTRGSQRLNGGGPPSRGRVQCCRCSEALPRSLLSPPTVAEHGGRRQSEVVHRRRAMGSGGGGI